MTKGNILKSIIIFAIPCILSKILQNLYSLVDSIMVGKVINENALAAVGACGPILSLFIDTIMGLMCGFSIIASKKKGKDDSDGVKKVFFNSLFVSIIISISMTILGTFLARYMLIAMKTPTKIIDDATKYLRVSFIGISTIVFYNFFCEMLKALGDSKKPLLFLFISSIIHIILLLAFCVLFKLGVKGAAYSTILSQAISVVICIVYIQKKVPIFKLSKEDLKIDKSILKECFKLGIPMAITNFVVMFGVIILSFITNKIGVEYVAAYSCASKIGYIVTAPIFGFAASISIFVSQNYGAKEYDRINKGIRQTNILISLINLTLFILMMLISKPLLSSILNGNMFAVYIGQEYLIIRCTAMYALSYAAIYKSVLTAIEKPLFPTISGFIEIGIRYIIPVSLSAVLGFLSVPLTDAISWIILALFLTPIGMIKINQLTKMNPKGMDSVEKTNF